MKYLLQIFLITLLLLTTAVEAGAATPPNFSFSYGTNNGLESVLEYELRLGEEQVLYLDYGWAGAGETDEAVGYGIGIKRYPNQPGAGYYAGLGFYYVDFNGHQPGYLELDSDWRQGIGIPFGYKMRTSSGICFEAGVEWFYWQDQNEDSGAYWVPRLSIGYSW